MKTLLTRIIEPKQQIPLSRQMFSNHDLKVMIIPLLVEQLLQMVVGMLDTMMVSYAGESVVSGVSLDTTIYTVFIYLFVALASGGAVVVSQCIGAEKKEKAVLSASQIFFISGVFSVVCMILVTVFRDPLLFFLYRQAEPDVISTCQIYLSIVAISLPANAIYNVGAALYRSMGRTDVTMRVSIAMNLLNVLGNAVGIFVLHAGAAGVAWPTTISWYFAAVVMTGLCFNQKNLVFVRLNQMLRPHFASIRLILRIAIPNAVENGLFQLTKVVLSAMVSTFGTAHIAANGIGQTLWTLSATLLVSCGPVYTTVIGRCMGAGDPEAADYYIAKLLRMTRVMSAVWNALITALLPLILSLYSISEEVRYLLVVTCLIHNIFSAVIQPYFNPLPSGLRAAGDVRYTMVTAILSSVFCRMALSYLFSIMLGMGVVGIVWAMVMDWGIKGTMTYVRYRRGKWKTAKVL